MPNNQFDAFFTFHEIEFVYHDCPWSSQLILEDDVVQSEGKLSDLVKFEMKIRWYRDCSLTIDNQIINNKKNISYKTSFSDSVILSVAIHSQSGLNLQANTSAKKRCHWKRWRFLEFYFWCDIIFNKPQMTKRENHIG